MPLKAGTNKPGFPGELIYDGSMAQAIELAFLEEWKYIMKTDPPQANDQMRLLFIAVAQGVVKHLKDHAGSITTNVPSTGAVGAAISTEGALHNS